ncbi:MAG: hypothetical protein IPI68_11240 [Chitinophagaceae bacterium]|nr:hypothetical protein [Chitinophagaceae bacterium]
MSVTPGIGVADHSGTTDRYHRWIRCTTSSLIPVGNRIGIANAASTTLADGYI